MTLEAVFFDVGETLVDETETWGAWADWLRVPRLTFFAALGAVIARDGRHHEVFDLFCPGQSFEEILRAREAEDPHAGFTAEHLYPDAHPCLQALHGSGYRIGIAGNQPARAADVLRESGLPFDWLVMSDLAGVEKPAAAFFEHLCQQSGLNPEQIAYVGDRVDNDVVPAARAGMLAVHLRRGPWGVIQADRPEAEAAGLRLSSLAELPERLTEMAARA
jgi:HAD superfamily hydrolase (TIGR01662 family)